MPLFYVNIDDTTMFLQNGMNYVVVPSDGAQEFFRLVKPQRKGLVEQK